MPPRRPSATAPRSIASSTGGSSSLRSSRSPRRRPEPNGWRGGFTAMVGNPPWERVKMQEQEFFAQRDAESPTRQRRRPQDGSSRRSPRPNPALHAECGPRSRRAEATSHFLRKSGRYPLCGVGDVNTYAVFAELFRSSIAPTGRMGIITPTGLATDATTSAFFADTVSTSGSRPSTTSRTRPRSSQGVHNQFRFAVTAMTGGAAGRRCPSGLLHAARHRRRSPGDSHWHPRKSCCSTRTPAPCRCSERAAMPRSLSRIYRRFPVLVRGR